MFLTISVIQAIQLARTLSWAQCSRLTFLLADWPCHGRQYHNDSGDSYPDGTPGIDILKELKGLATQNGGQAGMNFHFGRITAYCDKMISVFNDNGIPFHSFDMNDPSKLSSSVSSSVRKSISKSVSVSRSKSRSKTDDFDLVDDEKELKKYILTKKDLTIEEWGSIEPVPVKFIQNKPVESVDDFKTSLKFGLVRFGTTTSELTEENRKMLRLAKDPFAEGEFRLAYYGKLSKSDGVFDPSSPTLVFKTFKRKSAKKNERASFISQMEVSTIAQYLAEEYNKSVRPQNCKKIRFLTVNIVEIEETADKTVGQYCVEEKLPLGPDEDEFIKYSNNTGYWNEDEINQSLLLFTLFTYQKTGGFLMVTDLQGICSGGEYILTDPIILSTDKLRFGRTNLGPAFMEKCMASTKAMMEEYGWDDDDEED